MQMVAIKDGLKEKLTQEFHLLSSISQDRENLKTWLWELSNSKSGLFADGLGLFNATPPIIHGKSGGYILITGTREETKYIHFFLGDCLPSSQSINSIAYMHKLCGFWSQFFYSLNYVDRKEVTIPPMVIGTGKMEDRGTIYDVEGRLKSITESWDIYFCKVQLPENFYGICRSPDLWVALKKLQQGEDITVMTNPQKRTGMRYVRINQKKSIIDADISCSKERLCLDDFYSSDFVRIMRKTRKDYAPTLSEILQKLENPFTAEDWELLSPIIREKRYLAVQTPEGLIRYKGDKVKIAEPRYPYRNILEFY